VNVFVKRVSVAFDRRPALVDASLDITQGSIVGLLGPSGAGKTTLIRCVVGLQRPQSGHVEIDGRKVPDKSLAAKIGYMAQEDALYPDLSGEQNLRFFASLYGLRGMPARAALETVFRLTRLTGEERKKVKNYSGGMRKRLSLAAALVHGPSLLILDEPTVGIDPVLRAEFWEKFRSLRNDGATLLLTTHVMDEADRCDKLALIFEGKVLAFGTPEEVRRGVGAATTEEAFLALRTRSLVDKGAVHA
jgi:ABC-2 type transport system ATP-binding protein